MMGGHGGVSYDSAFTSSLPPMNYETMMSMQSQPNQQPGQNNQHF